MIPKIIHYAWFGSELPQKKKKIINQWQEILPDWEFMLWNESNFPIDKFPFTQKKVKNKEYGYAADELRYYVLYKYGGFYFDLDMILKKNLDEFLRYKEIWGFQYDNVLLTSFIGSEPNQPFLLDILDTYQNKKNKSLEADKFFMPSNPFVTKIFLNEFSSFRNDGTRQTINDSIEIFPKDYFTYKSRNVSANYAEHSFDFSWGTKKQRLSRILKRTFKKIFPEKWSEISAQRGFQRTCNDYDEFFKK